jgi:hypothetical protein
MSGGRWVIFIGVCVVGLVIGCRLVLHLATVGF